MEIVFYIERRTSVRLNSITKLTKSATTPKEGFEFAITFCKEFALVTPLAFEHEGKLYYYDDTDVDAYLNNQMSIEEFLEKNYCDALVRNTEVLVLSGEEIDEDSLFMVRGKYAYYISDYGIRIPLVDLSFKKLILK
jgi:hypothetical protein